MKNTKQKKLILDIVENSYSHYNADQIYHKARESMPNISLGTVYRNLNNLVDEELVRRIKTYDGIDRFDHNKDCHAHFICNRCDIFIDVDNTKQINDYISGNRVMSCEVIYKGICKSCLEKEN